MQSEPKEQQSPKAKSHYLLLFVKGLLMGLADTVPGVSGGSVAFVTGIYNNWIFALRSLRLGLINILFKQGLKTFLKESHFLFLATLFAGMAVGIKAFSGVILNALGSHPVLTWSLFLGLLISSTLLVLRRVRFSSIKPLVALVGGVLLGLLLTTLPILRLPTGLLPLFASGLIAISAMMLPGISGSFLLVILGQYEAVLEAVRSMDVLVLAVFGFGCVMGLLLFSRLLNVLIKRVPQVMTAAMGGLMVGSLHKLWPWQVIVEGRDSDLKQNVLPWVYRDLSGNDSFLSMGLLFFALGIAIPLLLDFGVSRLGRRDASQRPV